MMELDLLGKQSLALVFYMENLLKEIFHCAIFLSKFLPFPNILHAATLFKSPHFN